jgi:predicted aspartyl protease
MENTVSFAESGTMIGVNANSSVMQNAPVMTLTANRGTTILTQDSTGHFTLNVGRNSCTVNLIDANGNPQSLTVVPKPQA